jgi:hypothetical protein
MGSAHYQRRALLIISDGGDNNSRYRLKHIKELAQEADVAIYAIGLFDTALFKPFEEFMGRRWLQEITDVSGGRTVIIDDLTKLPEAASSISLELRNQYVIAYRPQAAARPGKRLIKVKVVPPQTPALQLYYRSPRTGFFLCLLVCALSETENKASRIAKVALITGRERIVETGQQVIYLANSDRQEVIDWHVSAASEFHCECIS